MSRKARKFGRYAFHGRRYDHRSLAKVTTSPYSTVRRVAATRLRNTLHTPSPQTRRSQSRCCARRHSRVCVHRCRRPRSGLERNRGVQATAPFLRPENVDQTGIAQQANALTGRGRIRFETGKRWDTAPLAEADLMSPLSDRYNSTINGKISYPSRQTPHTTYSLELPQRANTSIPGTLLVVGQQRINLGDRRKATPPPDGDTGVAPILRHCLNCSIHSPNARQAAFRRTECTSRAWARRLAGSILAAASSNAWPTSHRSNRLERSTSG